MQRCFLRPTLTSLVHLSSSRSSAVTRSSVVPGLFSMQQRWGHDHAPALPKVALVDVLKEKIAGSPELVTKRFEQLKRNHMEYLSLEINWNTYKPEQQAEFLRELEDLIKSGYHTMTPEQKKEVALENVPNLELDKLDFRTLDDILQKNEELQLGDWKKMTLGEKKGSWGPKEHSNTDILKAAALRTALFLLAAFATYSGILAYCRSKKDLPTLTPEYQEALRQRMIKERMNPYTGESAHLFTKDGIKSE